MVNRRGWERGPVPCCERDERTSMTGRSRLLLPTGVSLSRSEGSVSLSYREHGDGGDLIHKAEADVLDDGPAKPVRIWSRIGRRPILAGVTRTATFQCSSLRERRRVPRCATMTPCVSSTMWRARKNLWNSPMNMDGQWSALRTIGGKYSRSKIHAVDDTLNSCPFRLSADAKTVYLKDVFSFL